MRVAIYGGSFNPPHVGHAMVAAWLRWTARADQVWLLPTFRHAFEKTLAPWEDRVAMAEALATLLGPWCRVEPIEATLPVPSYTIRTLDALSELHPGVRLTLVVGADVAAQLDSWKDIATLRERYPVIQVGRAGTPVAGSPTFPDISSTAIRDALERGETVDHLVPTPVLARIAERGLYR